MKLKSALFILAMSLFTSRGADATATQPAAWADTARAMNFTIDSVNGAVLIPTNGATLCVISGNVRATEGSTTLTCDSLSILFRSSETNAAGLASLPATTGSGMDLQSITAEGNVVIKDEKGHATGDKAVYDQATDLLTLTGSRNLPTLKSADGKSSVTGKSEKTAFIFDRKSGIIRFEGPISIVGSTPTDVLSLPGTGTKK